MPASRLNELMIAGFTFGKGRELGRQLVLATDPKFAEKTAETFGVKPETLQEWANGYVALDAVISTMGALSFIQAIRKNRKGAGQAGQVLGVTMIVYSIYYLLYTLVGMRKAKAKTRAIDLAFNAVHVWAGYSIIKFSRKAFTKE